MVFLGINNRRIFISAFFFKLNFEFCYQFCSLCEFRIFILNGCFKYSKDDLRYPSFKFASNKEQSHRQALSFFLHTLQLLLILNSPVHSRLVSFHSDFSIKCIIPVCSYSVLLALKTIAPVKICPTASLGRPYNVSVV